MRDQRTKRGFAGVLKYDRVEERLAAVLGHRLVGGMNLPEQVSGSDRVAGRHGEFKTHPQVDSLTQPGAATAHRHYGLTQPARGN